MRDRTLSWLKLALKFAFAFGILFYMVQNGKLDLATVRQGFSHWKILIASALLIALSLMMGQFRWRLLLRGQGVELPWWHVVRYGMIGAFFNTTMPGAVSGDLIKAWYVFSERKGQPKTPVLTSIVLDRVMGVFGLIIVSASPIILFGPIIWKIEEIQKIILPVLMLFLAVVLFFTYLMLSVWGPLAYLRKRMEALSRYRLGRVFLKAYDGWLAYRDTPGVLVISLLLSTGNHLCGVGVIYLFAQAVGDSHLSAMNYFLLVPIGLLSTAIPIAPAGLGVGHAAFDWLFSLVGSSHGPEIFTLFVTLQICLNLTGIFFYLSSPKVKPQSTT